MVKNENKRQRNKWEPKEASVKRLTKDRQWYCRGTLGTQWAEHRARCRPKHEEQCI